MRQNLQGCRRCRVSTRVRLTAAPVSGHNQSGPVFSVNLHDKRPVSAQVCAELLQDSVDGLLDGGAFQGDKLP